MCLEGAGTLSLVFTFLSSVMCHRRFICNPYEKRRQFVINIEIKYTGLYCVIADNGNIHTLCCGTMNVARIDIYFRYSRFLNVISADVHRHIYFQLRTAAF